MLLLALTAFLAAALLTAGVRRLVLARGLVDVPNERSSHHRPTARGGGVAIVAVVLAGVCWVLWRDGWDSAAALGLLVGGAVVAAVGFLDDRGHVPAPVRLSVHLAALGGALWTIGGLPPLPWRGDFVDLGIAGDLLVFIACAWFLNLFNFMDGIDGIAASQAAFMGLAAAALAAAGGAPTGLVTVWLILAAASLGFLAWNWAPARIFMGDVGSGFLGFTLALLLVYSTGHSVLTAWTAIILGSTFVADASMTLLARMTRGERWYSAHRSHAYQWLARRWGSHARVTSLFIAINLGVVLPAAWLSVERPQWGPVVAAVVLAVLMTAARNAGAGRPERASAGD